MFYFSLFFSSGARGFLQPQILQALEGGARIVPFWRRTVLIRPCQNFLARVPWKPGQGKTASTQLGPKWPPKGFLHLSKNLQAAYLVDKAFYNRWGMRSRSASMPEANSPYPTVIVLWVQLWLLLKGYPAGMSLKDFQGGLPRHPQGIRWLRTPGDWPHSNSSFGNLSWIETIGEQITMREPSWNKNVKAT